MHAHLALALLPIVAQGVRIIQSNDDGWAESNIRELYYELDASGHDVVLSAPAENKSGTGSSDSEPQDRRQPCQYNSCPANSGPVGTNASDPRLNWVNSYPVTSMRYGIDEFGPQFWGNGQLPDIAVSGPNVGSNIWLAVPFSGTVGAAVFAVHERGVPAIAFSGASNTNYRWDTSPVPRASSVYAELAAKLTNKILASGRPYLPDDVWLNVNFPEVNDECSEAGDFKWVLSRITPGWFSPADVNWCGDDRLPTELDVSNADGCYIPISIGDAKDKSTVNDVTKQAAVLNKIRDMLVCLP